MRCPWSNAAVRAVAFVGLVAVVSCGCGSATHGARPSPATQASSTVSTVDPNAVPNPDPYDVGDLVGLPGGWRAAVVAVQRGAAVAGLGVPPVGDDYVTITLRLVDVEGRRVDVRAASLFTLFDMANDEHHVITVPATPNGVDGAYAPGSDHTGRLVFSAPLRSQLRMVLDGQQIGTQQSIFQIDPPKTPPRD